MMDTRHATDILALQYLSLWWTRKYHKSQTPTLQTFYTKDNYM